MLGLLFYFIKKCSVSFKSQDEDTGNKKNLVRSVDIMIKEVKSRNKKVAAMFLHAQFPHQLLAWLKHPPIHLLLSICSATI